MNKKGFTLIELLVVIVIISILTIEVISAFSKGSPQSSLRNDDADSRRNMRGRGTSEEQNLDCEKQEVRIIVGDCYYSSKARFFSAECIEFLKNYNK